MKKIWMLHSVRRLTQAGFILLIFVMPVFNIFVYGAGYIALHIFVNAILPWVIVLSVFPLMGLFLGRFFCGWLCPEGALFELADFLSLRILGRRSLYGRKPNDPEVRTSKTVRMGYVFLTLLLLMTVPLLSGIALTGYFIAPKTIWHQIVVLQLSAGVKAGLIGVSVYMFATSIFVRHTFCKYVCAPGLMQMLFGWVSPLPLRVRFDRENFARCTDCRRCEKACFMGVKPRLPGRTSIV